MNKDLKDRIFDIPENVITYLKYQVNGKSDGNSIGVKRANTLLADKKVTYGQLKRIIHDLKNINKTKEIIKYNLYGGDPMVQWANTILKNERDLIKNRKYSQKRTNEISGSGANKNPFITKHTKKASVLPPVNILKSNSDKSTISTLKLSSIFEELLKK